jgi:transposase
MPLRPLTREQTWLLPPSLDELISRDHPARFVAAVVDALEPSEWAALGIGIEGDPLGAPAYHPRALLGVWLYGFMTRVRSSRRLEAACRDQMPYLWLTGWQHPDHNTLWRFYQAHRDRMRRLLKRTVHMAMNMGLLDMAVQAVDGTKLPASASKRRTYSGEGLKEAPGTHRGGDKGTRV